MRQSHLRVVPGFNFFSSMRALCYDLRPLQHSSVTPKFLPRSQKSTLDMALRQVVPAERSLCLFSGPTLRARSLPSVVHVRCISGDHKALLSRIRPRTVPGGPLRGDSLWSMKSPFAPPPTLEQIWEGFFNAPQEWWDHRADKTASLFPDFKNKKTAQGLWVQNKSNPDWVEEKVAALAPGSVPQTPIAYNATLSELVKAGKNEEAMQLYRKMKSEAEKIDSFAFAIIAQACGNLCLPEEAKNIHLHVVECGYEWDIMVGICLIDMYSKCFIMEDAVRVFFRLPSRPLVTWNTMFTGYLYAGQPQKTLDLYCRMQAEGVKPDPDTFVLVLNACALVGSLELGGRMHNQVIQNEYEEDIDVGNCLVNMYGKRGSIEKAEKVFNEMPKRDVVTWTSLLVGHVSCGQSARALELYKRMQDEGMTPNNDTFVTVGNACAFLAALEEGKKLHSQVIESGSETDVLVGSSLIDMYAKCGQMEDALKVFNRLPAHTVVSWTALIAAFLQCGYGQVALDVYRKMQANGVKPNASTYAVVADVCANLVSLTEGRAVHSQAIHSKCDTEVNVASSLVNMYSKCLSMEDAHKIFNGMKTRSTTVWTAIIEGYVNCGLGQQALELYRQMQNDAVRPEARTFTMVATACAIIGSLEEGRRVHGQAIRHSFQTEPSVARSLINMYAKAGSVEDSQRLFVELPVQTIESWTTILEGLSLHGYGREAIKVFEQMHQSGVKMTPQVFTYLLSSCSRASLVDEGLRYFESMNTVHGVPPTAVHYSCAAELLGRAGRVVEAEELIKKAAADPTVNINGSIVVAWSSVASACRNRGNVEIGERAARQLIELDPTGPAGYVMLSNIYGAAGQLDRRDEILRLKHERNVKKLPGVASIELSSVVNYFGVNDKSHPEADEVYAEIKRLYRQMEEGGYVPDTGFTLHDVEDETEEHLCHHGEKLAIAFGIVKTPPGIPLRIHKNVTVCRDCHSATKFITKMVKRKIVIRDANRFHHIKDGLCSCKDYW